MTRSVGRRHGDALREAALAAALAEVAEHGVTAASMDRIAKRAGTGKAALYRRWPNAPALCRDALVGRLEQALPSAMVDTGSLRDDIVGSMSALTDQLGGNLGVVVRALIGEAARDSTVAIEIIERFELDLQLLAIANVQRAMQRGEIPPQTIDPYVMAIPAALLIHQLLFTGSVPSEAEFAHIVDAIVMPLFQQPSGPIQSAESGVGPSAHPLSVVPTASRATE